MQTFKTNNIARVATILAIFAILSAWLMQHSINAYYLQTYHKTSPLEQLTDEPLWRLGGTIGNRLYIWRDALTNHLNHRNQKVVSWFNQHYAFDQSYALQQQIIQAKHQRKIQMDSLIAKQRNDETLHQKLRYSLGAGDAIFLAGDSMMQGVAPHLQQKLSNHGITSINLSKQSTGLAYAKLFNWPQTIQNTLNDYKNIKILVMFLGPNDPWDMPDPKTGRVLEFGSTDWATIYQERMKGIIDNAKTHNVAIIWIMPPNMKKTTLNEHMITLNNIMQDELARHDVLMVDTRQLLKTTNNRYSDYTNDNDGKAIKMRSNDGIHFTPSGQKLIANHIYGLLNIE